MGCVNSKGCNTVSPSDRLMDMTSLRMSENEITWSMYQPCIDAGACPDNTEDGGDKGWGKANLPVVNVNWYDITEHYLPWLNLLTGLSFRLPTLGEWE